MKHSSGTLFIISAPSGAPNVLVILIDVSGENTASPRIANCAAPGGLVDAKILRSLTEEVEHVQRRIAELEDAELELMGQLEEATERRDKVATAKEQIDVKLRAEVAARDEAVAALDGVLGIGGPLGPAADIVAQEIGRAHV